jgi:hypothetical protein
VVPAEHVASGWCDHGRQGYQYDHFYGSGGSTTGGSGGIDGITTGGTVIGGSPGTVIGGIVTGGTLTSGIAIGGCGPGVVPRL